MSKVHRIADAEPPRPRGRGVTPTQRRILRALERFDMGLTAKQISASIGAPLNSVRTLLYLLQLDGRVLLDKHYGAWRAVSEYIAPTVVAHHPV